MCNKIPAGFQIKFTSHEMGENELTKILSGLSESDVRFYIDLANLFHYTGQIGNTFITKEILVDIIDEVLDNHPSVSSDTKNDWYCDDELSYKECADKFYQELADSVLGYPQVEVYDNSEHTYFCRAFDSFEVFYIKEPIDNVTKQF